MPFGVAGGLDAFPGRVHGALVATHTPAAWAVRRWYPWASFLSGDGTAGLEDTGALMRQWGGLGTDGYLGVGGTAVAMGPAGQPHHLSQGFWNVVASGGVRDVSQSPSAGAHSRIEHPEVAWLIVDAATT